MAARGGNFQCAPGCQLAFDIGQVRVGADGAHAGRWRHTQGAAPVQHGAYLQQGIGLSQAGPWPQGSLGGAGARQHQGASGPAGGHRHQQCAANRAQFAAERQLANKFMPGQQAGADMPGGSQNTQRNRQVKPTGLLGEICRCQVDGDAPGGKLQPGQQDGGAHPLATFPHLGVRQPNQGQRRQAVGQVNFYGHFRGVGAGQRPAMDARQ